MVHKTLSSPFQLKERAQKGGGPSSLQATSKTKLDDDAHVFIDVTHEKGSLYPAGSEGEGKDDGWHRDRRTTRTSP
eukprot:scaffold12766_cov117-Isochrysis_galbana.AAC.6